MTACLTHTAPLHPLGHLWTKETASTPPSKPGISAGSKNLLRVLTGTDGMKLPRHPHRRRSRRS